MSEIGEGGNRVVEEHHHPEPADGDIEATWSELMPLRVTVLKADVRQAVLAHPLDGPAQQRHGQIHPER